MMGVWISNVRIEGIRGFNRETSLKLGPGLNLLTGRNGSGKTSFLQAIEWCLTGKMSHMEGDEFSREDAVVNLFSASGEGNVTVTLQTPGGQLEVSRRRKRGRSTARGSSPLTLKVSDGTLDGGDAEARLQRILGLPIDEISSIVYLHQAALRAILSDDSKERSRSIDRMLGMEEIRSLAEALSSKRNITTALKQLQTRIETLRRDKVQFALMTRERLEQAKTRLIQQGFPEEEFALTKQVERATSTAEKSSLLKRKYGFPGLLPDPPSEGVDSVRRFVESMKQTILLIDRQRSEALRSVSKEKILLEVLKDQVKHGLEEVLRLEASQEELDLTRKSLEVEQKGLADNLNERIRRASDLSSLVSALSRAKDRLEAIRAARTEVEASISRLESTIGDREARELLVSDSRTEALSIDRALESLSSLEKLLHSAVGYITETRTLKCPVCEQPITPEDVISLIKKSMSDRVSSNIESLKSKRKSLLSRIHDLEAGLKELRELSSQQSLERGREAKVLEEAGKEIGVRLELDPDPQIEARRIELQSVESEIRGLRDKMSQTSMRLQGVTSKLDLLNNARDRLATGLDRARERLGTTADRTRLLKELDEEIAKTTQSESDLENVRELDSLKKSLDRLEEINNFSRSEVELDRIEREVPTATALIEDLERRASSLRELDASLAAIKEVVTNHEQKSVSGLVESLEDSFNSYFQELAPHDHFKKIRVELEGGPVPVYSIRALGEDQSTFITTRFSSAQMNAAAIALFLARHEQVSTSIGTILLDDPIQSMDSAHKNAVFKSVVKLVDQSQVILATQDEDVKALTKNSQGEVKTFEFHNWTIDGPTIA